MNIRSSNVDLSKFIGSLIIMTQHVNIIMHYFPFEKCWIYVEFFLMITGYFTIKHFDGKNYNNPIKESVIYTLKKFISFLPYTVITTLLYYLLEQIPKIVLGEITFSNFISHFINNFTFDILLINESFSGPMIVSLWYISAMFIVFPIFSWFVQIHNRYLLIVITAMYSLFYYGNEILMGNGSFHNDFLRVLAGLCLGVFIYEITYVFCDYLNKINKMLLTIIEVITFLVPIIIIFKRFSLTPRFILFCFTICLSIMLPNLSYTSKIKGKVFNYLGRLSMPIYIIHMLISKLIEFIDIKIMTININVKIGLYYIGTIIVCMIAMYLVDHWKWFQNINKKPIKLKD